MRDITDLKTTSLFLCLLQQSEQPKQKMKKWKSREDLASQGSASQYHYHTHYHYSIPSAHQLDDPEASHTNETYHHPWSSKQARTRQELYFSSEQHEWKRYLNPKVSRMYEEYQLDQSRYSQNDAKNDKVLESLDLEPPRRSAVLLGSKQPQNLPTLKRQLKKLEELYNQRRELKGSLQQKNRSQITMLTSSETGDLQQRMRQLEKQIQRLRNIEQECIYLREKFYLHVVSHHSHK